ncbi:unnamed protein product [Hydatigera taeniaeformis]|uniref:Endoplasmic reticulum transmembrane protein n=1 Tax=Hydatigena taeniaeformis TaxID=6205 RepID=A0A0R3WN21_HYDTA|nr:unnamed protein product [Hydatigera taeniaeformis]
MSLLWTITATFLYTEAAVITLLLMPFISSKMQVREQNRSVYLMKLFRAQRNLYISGFCLFLWFGSDLLLVFHKHLINFLMDFCLCKSLWHKGP